MPIKLSFLFLFISITVFSQKAVEVVKSGILVKVNEPQIALYGFAEGDEVTCEYKVFGRKNNIQFELSEYKSTTVFAEYRSKKGKKTIRILRTGIYQLKISNASQEDKACSVDYTITRIPKDENTQNFNTHVYWKEKIDTLITTEKGRFHEGKDTSIVEIIEQTAKVHSATNVVNGNDNEIEFSLPKSTAVWSYYIGVEQEGAERYAAAVRDLAKSASPLLKLIPNYGPMAALALNGASFLTVAQTGEDIDFCFIDLDKAKISKDKTDSNCFKKGFVINDFRRVTNKLEGNYKLILSNDNLISGVTVFVKITAIVVYDRFTNERQVKSIKKSEIPYLKD